MGSQPPTLSLCCDGSQNKQWLQEPLSPSFLSLAKNWTSLEVVMMLWKECLRVLLLFFMERRFLLQQQTMETIIWSKKMRYRGVGRWPCAAAHMLNRVIKSTWRKWPTTTTMFTYFQGSWGQWSSTQHFRRKWKKRGIKKINDYSRDNVGLHLHVCTKDILEKWNKLCRWKKEIRKGLLLEVTSFKKQQRSHWWHTS